MTHNILLRWFAVQVIVSNRLVASKHLTWSPKWCALSVSNFDWLLCVYSENIVQGKLLYIFSNNTEVYGEPMKRTEKITHSSERIQDFPDGVAKPKGRRQPIIWSNFAKNCMKMTNLDRRARVQKFYYVDPPLQCAVRFETGEENIILHCLY